MSDKLNPDALAECGDDELNSREGVQPVNAATILGYVLDQEELPPESARPFAGWLHEFWNDFNEDGELTNGAVISGALAHWRGQ